LSTLGNVLAVFNSTYNKTPDTIEHKMPLALTCLAACLSLIHRPL